jgi:hypothetical protein
MIILTKTIEHILNNYSHNISGFNEERPRTPPNLYFDNLDNDIIITDLFNNNISLSISQVDNKFGSNMLYCYVNLFEWDAEPVCEVKGTNVEELTDEINKFLLEFRQ